MSAAASARAARSCGAATASFSPIRAGPRWRLRARCTAGGRTHRLVAGLVS